MRQTTGQLDGRSVRFGIVVARFNETVTERLLSGAVDCLTRHGATSTDLHVVRVPGAYEIPLAAQALSRTGDVDAVICLGALIRGATPHFDVLASQVTSALGQIQLAANKPVTFGVLTCDTSDQAAERAGGKAGNKGWEAALAALEMVNLLRELKASAQ